jgi:hypothetical protein
MATDTAVPENNQVLLRGAIAAEAVLRTLPSGDELVSFRITVARPPGDRVRVDSSNAQVRSRRYVDRQSAAGPAMWSNSAAACAAVSGVARLARPRAGTRLRSTRCVEPALRRDHDSVG